MLRSLPDHRNLEPKTNLYSMAIFSSLDIPTIASGLCEGMPSTKSIFVQEQLLFDLQESGSWRLDHLR